MPTTKPLLCNIGNTDLLSIYGHYPYSDIWTYNQAWQAATRQVSSQLFAKLRQEMLQLHQHEHPDDPRWNK